MRIVRFPKRQSLTAITKNDSDQGYSKPFFILSNTMLLQCCRSAARSSKPLVLGPRISHLGPKKIVFGSYLHGVNMSSKNAEEAVIYTGPLATVAKRLKLFSISSLGLSGAISPFVFILDFPVPVFAKSILVGSGKYLHQFHVH